MPLPKYGSHRFILFALTSNLYLICGLIFFVLAWNMFYNRKQLFFSPAEDENRILYIEYCVQLINLPCL